MSSGPDRRALRVTMLVAAGAAAAGCGRKAADPNDREVPWTYGPTTGGASAEHVGGTGAGKGGRALSKGWQCRLLDQKRLVVRPYQLAGDHPLFGKVALNIGLFDKSGAQIGMVRSGPVTKDAAEFPFELEDEVVRRLWDAVIWFVPV